VNLPSQGKGNHGFEPGWQGGADHRRQPPEARSTREALADPIGVVQYLLGVLWFWIEAIQDVYPGISTADRINRRER
jgi:hypothetical protein